MFGCLDTFIFIFWLFGFVGPWMLGICLLGVLNWVFGVGCSVWGVGLLSQKSVAASLETYKFSLEGQCSLAVLYSEITVHTVHTVHYRAECRAVQSSAV